MGLSISIDRIDRGDTKRLVIVARDADGQAFTPATLTATFKAPSGEADTYDLGDFTPDDGALVVQHTFDEAGVWDLVVHAVDAAGNAEVETGRVYVH